MIPLLLALMVAVIPAGEPDPAPNVGNQYAEAWAWCEVQYPGNIEMQDACRWGAFEMIPTTTVQAEWRA